MRNFRLRRHGRDTNDHLVLLGIRNGIIRFVLRIFDHVGLPAALRSAEYAAPRNLEEFVRGNRRREILLAVLRERLAARLLAAEFDCPKRLLLVSRKQIRLRFLEIKVGIIRVFPETLRAFLGSGRVLAEIYQPFRLGCVLECGRRFPQIKLNERKYYRCCQQYRRRNYQRPSATYSHMVHLPLPQNIPSRSATRS